MKRIMLLFLALCLLLCACTPAEETQPSTQATTQATEATTQATTEAATEATTAETTEATEPPVLYRHPLTGQPLDAPFTGRPTAVVINNAIPALPQYGISQADMIYEAETEGGVTRLMAIFTNLSDVGTIGPIRSGRTFFNSAALAYDAPIIHCGGSQGGITGRVDEYGTKIQNWEHINEQYYGEYFFRDQDRISAGVSREHTLFTKGEMLIEGLAARAYDMVIEEGADYGLQFADELPPAGEPASTVVVNFRYGKTTTMTLDPETGLYEANQYNREHIDGATGECIAYRNVLVLYTTQRGISDGTYIRSYYDTIGSGTGHFACDGQIVPIHWQREDYRDPFTYTLEDGTPVTLGTGNSYVAIVSSKTPVTYE